MTLKTSGKRLMVGILYFNFKTKSKIKIRMKRIKILTKSIKECRIKVLYAWTPQK